MNTENVKGFNDYTGLEALKRQEIKKIISETFAKYGFEPAETPIIEYEEFVKGNNTNDEAVSDVFKLEDKGKRKLALRYELTFQLKRIAKNKKLPFKRYQIAEVFRDEPTSTNRFRQFTQCDVDVIGSSFKDEAEILMLVSEIFEKLGIKVTIYFNNRKLLNEILEEQKIKEKDRFSVIREIDKLDKLSEKEILNNLAKYNAEKILAIFKKPEKYFEKYNAYKDISELINYCKQYGVDIEFLPSLARGLSYYNSSIFEIKTKEIKETISAGGSYLIDGIQSTGISLGIERLFAISKIEVKKNQVLVVSIGQDKAAINLAKNLRDNNINVNLMLDKSPSKALEYANSCSITEVILLGEEEVKKKKFKLKNMTSGKEAMLNQEDLIKELS